MTRQWPDPVLLPTYDKKSGSLNVIIETPKGDRNKIDWDREHGFFTLSKVLPEGHVFPFDFGFTPRTAGEDGDPLDVLLLIESPVGYPGCLVAARPIGVIEAQQTERNGKSEQNNRLIAVAAVSRLYAEVETLDDLDKSIAEEIEHFFISYNEMSGKKFQPTGRGGPGRAKKLIEAGMTRFAAASS